MSLEDSEPTYQVWISLRRAGAYERLAIRLWGRGVDGTLMPKRGIGIDVPEELIQQFAEAVATVAAQKQHAVERLASAPTDEERPAGAD